MLLAVETESQAYHMSKQLYLFPVTQREKRIGLKSTEQVTKGKPSKDNDNGKNSYTYNWLFLQSDI